MRALTLSNLNRPLSAAVPRPGMPAGRLVVRRHIDLLRVDSALCPRNS